VCKNKDNQFTKCYYNHYFNVSLRYNFIMIESYRLYYYINWAL